MFVQLGRSSGGQCKPAWRQERVAGAGGQERGKPVVLPAVGRARALAVLPQLGEAAAFYLFQGKVLRA